MSPKPWEAGAAICRCSFCGRSQNDVKRLVASNNTCTAICETCVVRVVEVLLTGVHEPEEAPVALTPGGQALAAQLAGEAR